MLFRETKLKGSFVIEPEKYKDDRGFFARAFCHNELRTHGLNSTFVQANIGFSSAKGTLRGIHYQTKPYQEAKLIRCTRGILFDVIVDLRKDSNTYCQWFGIVLNADMHTTLYMPEGFAHGYLTLKNNTEIFYMVSQFYEPNSEKGIRWDDPVFDIEWPNISDMIISDKDKNWPDYAN